MNAKNVKWLKAKLEILPETLPVVVANDKKLCGAKIKKAFIYKNRLFVLDPWDSRKVRKGKYEGYKVVNVLEIS